MKILAVQNRMGIGDTVIFLPFIKALSKKFNSPISLLVKESSKADQYLYQTSYIDKILFLERDKKNNNKHNDFLGSLNLIKDIKKHKFDKIIIFNSSLRFSLIAKFCGIHQIYQYPLFQKTRQHITDTPKKFIKDKLNIDINDDPEIQIAVCTEPEHEEQVEVNFVAEGEKPMLAIEVGGSGNSESKKPGNRCCVLFMVMLIVTLGAIGMGVTLVLACYQDVFGTL